MKKHGKKLWKQLLSFVLLFAICMSMSNTSALTRLSLVSAAENDHTNGGSASTVTSDTYVYVDAEISNSTDAYLCVNGIRIENGTNSVPIVIEDNATTGLIVTFHNNDNDDIKVSEEESDDLQWFTDVPIGISGFGHDIPRMVRKWKEYHEKHTL